ncbi:unnamed protein product [Calypogeia fissa]
MKEPWPGDVFSNPLLFIPGVSDKKNLASIYEKLQTAVRSVDKERILFFETITFDNFRCGWSTAPGGVEWQNKTALQKLHVRTGGELLTEVNEEEIIQYAEGDERRRGDGEKHLESSQATPLLPMDDDLQKNAREVDSVDGVLSAAETYVQSWIGWEYKAFFHKTSSIAEQSLSRRWKSGSDPDEEAEPHLPSKCMSKHGLLDI